MPGESLTNYVTQTQTRQVVSTTKIELGQSEKCAGDGEETYLLPRTGGVTQKCRSQPHPGLTAPGPKSRGRYT